MKAAINNKYGPPEVVSIQDVAKPIPQDSEVLIKVYATTVNRTDSGFRSAQYFISRFFSGLIDPTNKILGCEFAGEITEIGKNVTKFKVGDRVFGFNDSKFGGHAEFLTLKETDALATIPADMSYEQAAPMTEGGHYALSGIRAAKLKAGQKVLVYGATGSIGSAAVQICKAIGAEVTAVCSTKNVDLVKSLGADKVVDYTQEDFTKTDEKFDFILDAVGKQTFGICKPLLTDKGIYISTELGPKGQNPLLALITPFGGGKRVLFPIPTSDVEQIVYLRDLYEAGKYKPVIDRTYKLDQIVEAYKYVETGQKIGNVVILIEN